MTTSRSIPIGVDSFGELVDPVSRYLFVDKTLFIQEILDDGSKVVLITRPRRWGKTLNLSMLEHFLAPTVLQKETRGLFDTLAIAQVEEGRYLQHQGQYPVILLSFKDVQEKQFTLAIKSMRLVLQELFSKHKPFLLSTGQLDVDDQALLEKYHQGAVRKVELQRGLLVLSKLLYKASQGKTVYILIDEYDTPLNYAYHHQYLDDMTEFMKNLLSAALKGNPYLKKGVMTGILRISKDSMLSSLNNLKLCSVMDKPYASHFGFTDTEVADLFGECGLTYSLEQIREYYNGYRIGDQKLYNPWSIIRCLDAGGALKPYWVNTADDSLLRSTFLNATPEMKTQLQTLISNEEHQIEATVLETLRFEEVERDSSSFWSLLVATGYLTPVHQESCNVDYRCTLAIPNQEVKQLYVSIFQKWKTRRLSVSCG